MTLVWKDFMFVIQGHKKQALAIGFLNLSL